MNQQLKVQWDYTREEIKAFVKCLVDNFEKSKVLNEDPLQQDFRFYHKHSLEMPFGLHDGFCTHNLVMYEYVEKKQPLYGLYIKSIEKDGLRPGEDWTSLQPVTKFWSLDEFLSDQLIDDMFNHFQNNKKFKESLKKEKAQF